jgi:hypothetical protein
MKTRPLQRIRMAERIGNTIGKKIERDQDQSSSNEE